MAALTDTLRARQGDTLDALIWRERGLGPADLPTVLAANPGLAAIGPILPKGQVVTIPAIATPAVTVRADVVNLWD
ncbi:phage tail protein X [Sphingomonas insulae]|uniref:Tail protein X n=1 Tax=Sphingomonas insulae TaxID=424800 RepID=A0ABN1HY74_9SPHN|nr:tail protein X [Sphingomonas insulae]NIJ29732.1 phage tail protein X [Sphingomonas insulae]